MALPKLRKDDSILIQSKYAVSNIDSIAAVLTCLSVEADRNKLTSMTYVLLELANGLSDSSSSIETLIRFAERQYAERQKEENEKNKKN